MFWKQRIFLTTLININSLSKNRKTKYLSYNEIIQKHLENNENNTFDDDIDSRIFDSVGRVSHQILHKGQNINGKIIKNYYLFKELNLFDFKEKENINYNNIDKLINSLKQNENYHHLEFIAIKSIIVSIINLSKELINNYLKNTKNINVNFNKLNEDGFFPEDNENNIVLLNPYLFETIYNDYSFIYNQCTFLENYFIESFNNFRKKYQISFVLKDLFTDIFWNYIFHNEMLSKKFISIYIGNDNVCSDIRKILSDI